MTTVAPKITNGDWNVLLVDETTYKTGETRLEVVEQLIARGCHVFATGSRVTTHFDPKESDWDYVVLDEDFTLANHYTMEDFWYQGESGNQYSDFLSRKKIMKDSSCVVNLIFVPTKEVFNQYVMATNLIRKVDPKTKAERIELFDLIFKSNGLPV